MENDIADELESIWEEAKTNIKLGNYDKAVQIYKYILIRYSDDVVAVKHANAYLGEVYLALKRADEAQIYIQRAVNFDPKEPSYRYLLGFAYLFQRKWREAIKEFENAADKEPDNGEYLRGLGWAIYNSGDTQKGLAYLRKGYVKDPKNINILNDLAVVYLGLSDFTNATLCIKEVLNIDPYNLLAEETLKRIEHLEKKHRLGNTFDK